MPKIDFGQNPQPKPEQRRTFISPTLIKERVMLDRDGNQIDPKTKQIIKLAKDL